MSTIKHNILHTNPTRIIVKGSGITGGANAGAWQKHPDLGGTYRYNLSAGFQIDFGVPWVLEDIRAVNGNVELKVQKDDGSFITMLTVNDGDLFKGPCYFAGGEIVAFSCTADEFHFLARQYVSRIS